MSTVPKQTKPQATAPVAPGAKPAATTYAAKKPMAAPKGNQVFLFNRDNYMWMIGGVVLILLGFALMAGGKSANPHEFHADEIFSFRRITLAPIVLLAGFVVEIFAIMKKPKDTQVA